MNMEVTTVLGGCACGGVRFTIAGPPKRVGLCHCMTCRKAHAAAFNPFAVFAKEQVGVHGAVASWESSAGYLRQFCPTCGSRVANIMEPKSRFRWEVLTIRAF